MNSKGGKARQNVNPVARMLVQKTLSRARRPERPLRSNHTGKQELTDSSLHLPAHASRVPVQEWIFHLFRIQIRSKRYIGRRDDMRLVSVSRKIFVEPVGPRTANHILRWKMISENQHPARAHV